ncbi:MAG: extracellular solute-binding protein [Streptosporangiaceae bacterium]
MSVLSPLTGRWRWTAALAGILVGLGWVVVPHLVEPDAGCGDNGSGMITVAAGTDVSFNTQRRTLLRVWNERVRKLNGDPEARLEEIGSLADVQRSQMIGALQSGGCRYDALALDLPWIEEFYRRGLLAPLRGFAQEDRHPQAWQAGVRGKNTYAVPFDSDVALLYYRTGGQRPQSWADIDKVPRKAGYEATYAGQFASYEGLTVNLLELLWSVDPGGTLESSPRTIKVVNELIGRMNRPVFPAVWRESVVSAEQETTEAFLDGKVLMMRNWPYVYRILASQENLNPPGRPRLFAVTQLPGPSVLGGHSLALARTSPHKDATRRLIEFLTGSEAQQLLFSCGGFAPSRIGALRETSCAQAQRRLAVPDDERAAPVTGSDNLPEEQLKPLVNELRKAFEKARLRPVSSFYSEYSTTLQCHLYPYLRDRSTFDAAGLRSLRDALQAALRGTGPTGCG